MNWILPAAFLALLPALARAENASAPLGEPVLEPATLHSLGVYWIVKGDDNKNAGVALSIRKNGAAEWTRCLPLWRVERGAPEGLMMRDGDRKTHSTKLQVPPDGWLFAGSAVLLEPGTDYELKLKFADADGGSVERVLKCATRAEPQAPADAAKRFVVPGDGGGKGTADDPFKGLAAAQKEARPGDLFLVGAGIYSGTFEIKHSGEPGKPIIWRGVDRGTVVLDGGPQNDAGRVISATDIHDVWFENLTLRNAGRGMVLNGSARMVVRRCHIHTVHSGITATRNPTDTVSGFFIADNVIEGLLKWVPPEGKEWREMWDKFEDRGIELTGSGHDVCYNRIRNFKDAIDTFPSAHCAAIDFHHNDCSELIDDGCEVDFSERNTRCFCNRFTNVFQGISAQPVFGGPVYIFRNALYNVYREPFKLHNRPSGVLVFHNTIVKFGEPFVLSTTDSPRNCVFRNNLFIGTPGGYAALIDPKMVDCDFDFDGFGGGPWNNFLKWNGVRYKSLADAGANAPVYRNAILVDAASAFSSGLKAPASSSTQFDASTVDLRLKAGSAAIDSGEVLPGFNQDFKGKAPDLGAYEFGTELPRYGPRPEK